jgi:hypothetical protein
VSDRFFAVLATTLSFLARFRPVKHGIEALDILYTLVKGWSVRFQFLVWSMVRSNLGQTWSTLVKLGRTWSKLSKLLEMYPGLHFKGFWARWVLVGLETAWSNLGQTLVNSSQAWSTLVKLGQTSGNVSRTFLLGVFDVAKCCQIVLVRFRLSRFAHRHPRESRGKNGVMTTPHGFTWGLVLLKDLSKTSNTVRYFHAQIKVKKWTIFTIT